MFLWDWLRITPIGSVTNPELGEHPISDQQFALGSSVLCYESLVLCL